MMDTLAFEETPLEEVPYSVYPEQPFQDTNLSLVDSHSRYDLTRLSQHELDIIIEILKIANSNKYPSELHSLGLANEASVIKYKPRYILHEIIIQMYSCSSNPLDCLAVGEAYRTKGAMFYAEAISNLEYFLSTASTQQRRIAQVYLFAAREPFISYHLAELLDLNRQYEQALKYAQAAMDADTTAAPGFVLKLGEIYRKINPQTSIDFFTDILSQPQYEKFAALFDRERSKAVDLINHPQPYTGRKYKPSAQTVAFEQTVSSISSEFLQGGRFYALWQT